MSFKGSKIGGNFWVSFSGTMLIRVKTLGAAKRIARALNGAYRKATFKPKSAGSRARTKGHGFEREVAIALRGIFPEARRHLEYQDSEANGIDLVGTGPFKIQCKRLKDYAPLNRINEVQYDPLFGDIPVLVTAADGKRPLAALPFDDFIRLIKESTK